MTKDEIFNIIREGIFVSAAVVIGLIVLVGIAIVVCVLVRRKSDYEQALEDEEQAQCMKEYELKRKAKKQCS